MTIINMDPEELAARMMLRMDRDFAVAYLIPPGTRDDWTDDQLIALARAYAAAPKPEPTHCEECGQLLPEND
jgi:hypothetical protein